MKRFYNIITIAVSLIALCGCERSADLENVDIRVDIPKDGYIFFDTEVGSRGELIYDNLIGKDFSVLGYRYSEPRWTQVDHMAKQDYSFSFGTMGVFDDNSKNTNTPGVELVSYDSNSGSHKYEPLKEWDNKLYYSFFAWYPSDLVSSGSSYEGNPYITYNFDTTNPTNHKDVMTACALNINSGTQKSVSLQMEHRLSAIDINARSSVNAKSLGLAEGRTAYVKITNLGVTFDNLLYSGAKIPLNTVPDENGNVEKLEGQAVVNWTKNLSFGSLVNNEILAYDQVTKMTSNVQKTMILVPQEDVLNCQVNLTYDIVNENGTSIWNELFGNPGTVGYTGPSKTPENLKTAIKKLEEGIYYTILLTFTKSGVSIEVLEAEQWDDKDVSHEFE